MMRNWLVIGFILLSIQAMGQNKITAYEYWFDQDYSSAIRTSVTISELVDLSTSISVSSLEPGLHAVHFRFLDTDGYWSSVVSQFFIVPKAATSLTAKIDRWEYWFDYDPGSRVTTSISPKEVLNLSTSVSISALNPGLHVINLRARDINGHWSSVITNFFMVPEEPTTYSKRINYWEYWFDGNRSSLVTKSISARKILDLSSSFSTSDLEPGLHYISFRTRDKDGHWSSVLSKFFMVPEDNPSIVNRIVEWEYWYNNDYSSVVSGSLSSAVIDLSAMINTTALNEGFNQVNLRFKDEQGTYSSVLSRFFFKKKTTFNDNYITDYRYWFDTASSAMMNVKLGSPVKLYNLVTSVDVRHIEKGDHIIHFQFRDSLGQWSSVLSDSFNKVPFPIAGFSGVPLEFCDSGTVDFTSESFDADTWYWTFGDGGTSTMMDPSYHYSTSGTYNISLTVTDTASGLDSTLIKTTYVVVHERPDAGISASPNDSICTGDTAILLSDTSADLTWSTGDTMSSIKVTSPGIYTVLAANPDMPSCASTDSIAIEVISVPMVGLGNDTSICDGTILTLTADSGHHWTWSTGDTGNTISVSMAGTYYVDAFNILGCYSSDTITVGVDPLAVANWSYSITERTVDLTDLSMHAMHYDWSYGTGDGDTIPNPSYTYSSDGTYEICLIVSNNCNSDTLCQNITVHTSGIDDPVDGIPMLALYPNPARDQIFLVIGEHAGEDLRWNIVNMNGELMMSGNTESNTVHRVATDRLAVGYYLMVVEGKGYQASIPFVKAD